LTMASNSGDSSAPRTNVLSSKSPVRTSQLNSKPPGYNISARTSQKTHFFYCCLRVGCRGNVLTELLPRKDRSLLVYLAVIA
jgi:hypothetical protein